MGYFFAVSTLDSYAHLILKYETSCIARMKANIITENSNYRVVINEQFGSKMFFPKSLNNIQISVKIMVKTQHEQKLYYTYWAMVEWGRLHLPLLHIIHTFALPVSDVGGRGRDEAWRAGLAHRGARRLHLAVGAVRTRAARLQLLVHGARVWWQVTLHYYMDRQGV